MVFGSFSRRDSQCLHVHCQTRKAHCKHKIDRLTTQSHVFSFYLSSFSYYLSSLFIFFLLSFILSVLNVIGFNKICCRFCLALKFLYFFHHKSELRLCKRKCIRMENKIFNGIPLAIERTVIRQHLSFNLGSISVKLWFGQAHVTISKNGRHFTNELTVKLWCVNDSNNVGADRKSSKACAMKFEPLFPVAPVTLIWLRIILNKKYTGLSYAII